MQFTNTKIAVSKIVGNSGQIDGLPSNPRILKDEKFEKLKASLQDLPELLKAQPVIVVEFEGKFIAIAGNMRHKVAKDLKWKEIECSIVSNATPEELRRISIATNLSYGEWDTDILANEWDMVELGEWGLDLPNFQTENLEAKEDDYEQSEAMQVDVVLGDLIEIGQHRLLCGDSTDIAAVERLMGGEKADLWVTDAPYGVSYADKNEFLNSFDKGNCIQKEIENDHKTINELGDFWRSTAANALIVCKDTASYYWFFASVGGLCKINLQSLNQAGWFDNHLIIWVKNNHVLGRTDYAYKHEPIAFGWKKSGTHKFYGGFQTSVLEFNKPTKNDLHPTMKPVELISKLIENSSQQNELVYDSFLGSGTTMVAAHQLKRRCFGMELDPTYCQVIVDRMVKLDPNLEVKINGKPYKKAIPF